MIQYICRHPVPKNFTHYSYCCLFSRPPKKVVAGKSLLKYPLLPKINPKNGNLQAQPQAAAHLVWPQSSSRCQVGVECCVAAPEQELPATRHGVECWCGVAPRFLRRWYLEGKRRALQSQGRRPSHALPMHVASFAGQWSDHPMPGRRRKRVPLQALQHTNEWQCFGQERK